MLREQYGLAWDRRIPLGQSCYLVQVIPAHGEGVTSHIIECEKTGYAFRVLIVRDEFAFMHGNQVIIRIKQGDFADLRATIAGMCKLASLQLVNDEVW